LLGLWWKAAFPPSCRALCHQQMFGFRVTGYQPSTLLRLFKEVFLSEVYYFSTSSLTPIILDCGANIGIATLYFKKLYPHARILAFEPDPAAFALLKRNIAQNQLENVESYSFALSDRTETVSFYKGPEPGSLTGSLLLNRAPGPPIEVEAHELSDYLEKHQQIMLIKIDVEGMEGKILRNLQEKKVLTRADQYIIEIHHQVEGGKAGLSTLLSLFEEQEFGYFIKAAPPKAGNNQDLVFHFFQDRQN
jgi:FkbM family methyltransferase